MAQWSTRKKAVAPAVAPVAFAVAETPLPSSAVVPTSARPATRAEPSLTLGDFSMPAWRRVSEVYEQLRSLIGWQAEQAYFLARDERREPMHILWRLEDALRRVRGEDDGP